MLPPLPLLLLCGLDPLLERCRLEGDDRPLEALLERCLLGGDRERDLLSSQGDLDLDLFLSSRGDLDLLPS